LLAFKNLMPSAFVEPTNALEHVNKTVKIASVEEGHPCMAKSEYKCSCNVIADRKHAPSSVTVIGKSDN
jgi:hypothetical protein